MLLIQCPHPLAFCLLICSPLPSISVCPAQSQVEDHVSQLDSGVSVKLGLHSSCEAAGQICHSCSIPLSSDWSQWLQSGLDKQSYAYKISKIRHYKERNPLLARKCVIVIASVGLCVSGWATVNSEMELKTNISRLLLWITAGSDQHSTFTFMTLIIWTQNKYTADICRVVSGYLQASTVVSWECKC